MFKTENNDSMPATEVRTLVRKNSFHGDWSRTVKALGLSVVTAHCTHI